MPLFHVRCPFHSGLTRRCTCGPQSGGIPEQPNADPRRCPCQGSGCLHRRRISQDTVTDMLHTLPPMVGSAAPTATTVRVPCMLDGCPKIYAKERYMKEHFRKDHPKEYEEIQKHREEANQKLPISCPIENCSSRFRNKAELHWHKDDCHPGYAAPGKEEELDRIVPGESDRSTCLADGCPTHFKNKKNRDAHIKKYHPDVWNSLQQSRKDEKNKKKAEKEEADKKKADKKEADKKKGKGEGKEKDKDDVE